MLIVHFGCKIREKAPLLGLIIGIKRILIGKMQEKQMQFILSPLHKAINYDKSFAWFKNRLKPQKFLGAARPERAEAPSPGQRPGYNSNQQDAL